LDNVLIKAAALTILMGSAQLSLAQLEDNSTSGPGAERLIEEVLVTARRREEGLQDAPIAVSAYTGESLIYRGVEALDDIAKFVPGLTLENNPSFGGASNSAAIYLRGVGQKEFLATTEPGVGLYVDGVYYARSVGAILDIVDVERLEVLRGPQGTLFGRNTIGGAISITSVQPDPNAPMEGKIAATAGTDDKLNLQGTLHLPISDTFAARATVASFNQDGYVKRTDGTQLGDDDTLTGRIAFKWQPSDTFSADFAVDATRDRENGPALELIDIDFTDLSQLAGVVLAPPPPQAFIHNVAISPAGPGQPCAVTDPSGNGITSNPAIADCYDSRYIGAEENGGTSPAYSKSDILGLSAELNYQLSDTIRLKSITAWRELDSEFARDGDHSPHRIATFYDDLQQEQFSQELQLLGTHDNFNWIMGLYYFAEDGENTNILDFTVSNFRSGGAFDNKAWAAFAQATYDITDQLHLTVGARYTDEEKSFLPDQVILTNYFAGISTVVPPGNPLAALDAPFLQVGEPILPMLEKDINIDEFTPMVNLSYDFSDDVMLYVNYSEGFKSGGFTQRVFPPIVAGFTAPPGTPDIDLIPTYEPEFVEVFELGAKISLMDQRLRINAALFQSDYSEMQVQVFNSVAPVTENIGQATIEGFELELVAAPGNGWFIEASLALIDAQYDSIDTSVTLIGEDFDFERVPDTAASLGVSKDFPLNTMGMVTVRADWSYRSKTYNDAFNTPQLETGAYDLIDASIRWTNPEEDWSVMLSGRNLTDENYLVTGIYGTAFQVYEGSFDRGRQWQLQIMKRFN